MNCPRCQVPLHEQTVRTCAVGACLTCGGLWLSAEATRTVEAALDQSVHDVATMVDAHQQGVTHEESVGVTCPACNKILDRYRVADIEVDHCAAHGTWYDHGELKQVAAALARGNTGPAEQVLGLARAPTAGQPRDARPSEPAPDPAMAQKPTAVVQPHQATPAEDAAQREQRAYREDAFDFDFAGELLDAAFDLGAQA